MAQPRIREWILAETRTVTKTLAPGRAELDNGAAGR